MKVLSKTLLGAAIATLLATPLSASAPTIETRPLLSPPPASKRDPAPATGPILQLVVKFREGSGLNAAQRQAAVGSVSASLGIESHITRRLGVGADVVRMARALDPVETETILRQLRANPAVEYAHPDYILQPLFTPNDPLYTSHQWHYKAAPGGILLTNAWNDSQGDGIVVGVIDTGITSHSDLAANILPGYDFVTDLNMSNDGDARDADPSDPGDWVAADECSAGSAARNSSWHGTHVAGTIAAVTNNSYGVAGVAFDAKVVPMRVLGQCGGFTSDIADAITWGSGGTVPGVPANANVAEVLNLSLGGGSACDATSQAAINGAVSRGTVVVVAAGNSASSVEQFSPASCNNVIAVASNDDTGIRSGFSNTGGKIDVSAGGGSPGIASTGNSGLTSPSTENFLLMQGTSMASPHVAGVVALMQAISPHTPAEVEAMLKLTAYPMTGANCPGGCGAGRVDATRAVNAADGTFYAPLPTQIRTGVAQAVPSSGAATSHRFILPTESGATNLSFALAGGTGNADLYVKFGAKPTTTDFDCSSTAAGTTESCVIPTAQVGQYHVLVRAKTAISGVSLTGTFSSKIFANRNDLPIPDGTSVNVDQPIYVFGRPGNAPATTRVIAMIYHPYRGDVTVELVAPDGTVYPVFTPTPSDSGDNIDIDQVVDVSSEAMNGTWKLRMRDGGAADAGHLDVAKVRF